MKAPELLNFWEKLRSFIEKVQVNDQPGEEEKEIILSICEGWIKYGELSKPTQTDEQVIYANQKLVDFLNWYNETYDTDIPNCRIGEFNLSKKGKL